MAAAGRRESAAFCLRSVCILSFLLPRPHADVLQVPACAEICLGAVLSFAATARGGAPTFFRKESRQRFARGSAPLTPVSVLPRSHAPPSPEARPACGDFAPPNAGWQQELPQSSIAERFLVRWGYGSRKAWLKCPSRSVTGRHSFSSCRRSSVLSCREAMLFSHRYYSAAEALLSRREP